MSAERTVVDQYWDPGFSSHFDKLVVARPSQAHGPHFEFEFGRGNGDKKI